MVNGMIILEDGNIQIVGAVERWDMILDALQRTTQHVERLAAEQNKKKELLSKIPLEELERLANSLTIKEE